MKTLIVSTQGRQYPVHIGAGLLGDKKLLARLLGDREAMLVSNQTVAPLYAKQVVDALPGKRIARFDLPDGEQHKNLGQWSALLDRMVDQRLHRDAVVISLGGGVVSDIAGFAAACFQRGIDHLVLPTSLLAQVDAAVGGKTAINHPAGKNLIGAFHQPIAVISDISVLKTLDPRQMRAGLAEIIKSALIADSGFWSWLERHAPRLADHDEQALVHAIYNSCRIKATIVAADEREHGQRALLNLGHTFAHAIETISNYEYLHGEAVAIGLSLAAGVSVRCGLLDEVERRRIDELLTACDLPVSIRGLDPQRIRAQMGYDKKIRQGRIKLVLLTRPGAAQLSGDYDDAAVEEVLRASAAGK